MAEVHRSVAGNCYSAGGQSSNDHEGSALEPAAQYWSGALILILLVSSILFLYQLATRQGS